MSTVIQDVNLRQQILDHPSVAKLSTVEQERLRKQTRVDTTARLEEILRELDSQ